MFAESFETANFYFGFNNELTESQKEDITWNDDGTCTGTDYLYVFANDPAGPRPTLQATSVTDVPLGGSIDNEWFTMTYESMEVMSEYRYGNVVFPADDGCQLLVVEGHFKNKTGLTVSGYNTFPCRAAVNGSDSVYADTTLNFERDISIEIEPYTECDYALYVNIPNKLADNFESAVFYFGFNDELTEPNSADLILNDNGTFTGTDHLYAFSKSAADSKGKVSNNTNKYHTIKIDETITTDEYEFTIKGVELSYEVLPSDTSGFYAYYTPDSGKVYIDVKVALKNLMKHDISIKETFSVKAVYSDDYTYNGFVIVDDGNSFDWADTDIAATPLETATIHALVECPKEIDESNEPLKVLIKLSDGVTYEYTVR